MILDAMLGVVAITHGRVGVNLSQAPGAFGVGPGGIPLVPELGKADLGVGRTM